MESSFYHIPHARPRRSLLSVFPVPAFLEMQAAALDISDNSVKVLSLEQKGGVYSIGSYSSYDLPTGVIEGGHIKNKDSARPALHDAQQAHKLSLVNTSLPEERSYLFTMTVEDGESRSVRENIEFHLAENVPLEPERAVFDYEVFQEYTKKGRIFKEVSVSAASREVSENYTELVKEAGMQPLRMPMEAQATARAVVPRGDGAAYMVIDFGKTRTGVSIVSGGVTRFTSSVDIGGEKLTSILAKELQIAENEAEKVKREQGIAGGQAQEKLKEPLTKLIEEIDRNAHYWHSRIDESGERSKKITSIILCGGSSLLPGFQRFLRDKLSADVQLANVWVNTPFAPHVVPDITFEESLGYATTVGLAL